MLDQEVLLPFSSAHLSVTDSAGRVFPELWAQVGQQEPACYSTRLGEVTLPTLKPGQEIVLALRALGKHRPEDNVYYARLSNETSWEEVWRIVVPK